MAAVAIWASKGVLVVKKEAPFLLDDGALLGAELGAVGELLKLPEEETADEEEEEEEEVEEVEEETEMEVVKEEEELADDEEGR